MVGALYPSTGAMSERSAILPWGNVPHVWAPGVDLLMAVGSRDRWELGELYEAEAQGTSFGGFSQKQPFPQITDCMYVPT